MSGWHFDIAYNYKLLSVILSYGFQSKIYQHQKRMIQNVYGDDGHHKNGAQRFNLNFRYKDLSLFILYERGRAMTGKCEKG